MSEKFTEYDPQGAANLRSGSSKAVASVQAGRPLRSTDGDSHEGQFRIDATSEPGRAWLFIFANSGWWKVALAAVPWAELAETEAPIERVTDPADALAPGF